MVGPLTKSLIQTSSNRRPTFIRRWADSWGAEDQLRVTLGPVGHRGGEVGGQLFQGGGKF